MSLIYTLSCPVSGEVRYVGYTSRTLHYRIERHLWSARIGKQRSRVYRWIRALMNEGLKPTISALEEVQPGWRWQDRERLWILLHRAHGARLCNHSLGGEGNVVWIVSPETRARMSVAQKVKAVSDAQRTKNAAATKLLMSDPERRAAISAKLKGRKIAPEVVARAVEGRAGYRHSEDTKARIGAANRVALQGKVLSPETIAKRSAAVTGSKRSPETVARMRAAQQARRKAERVRIS
jgi:hypothetical protein